MAKVLMTYGGWEGHEPKATTERFAALLREKNCEVEVVDSLAPLAEPQKLQNLDLLVICWTMSEIEKDAVRTVTSAVENGLPLAGWHGGLGDAFRSATDFQFVTGGQFVAHPGNIKKYIVNVTDQRHPITRGLSDFAMNSEQYYLHVDPANRVLATTTFDGNPAPWVKDVVMPVAWTRMHGKGRVFYSALGHVNSDFDVPQARQLTLKGLLWAAGSLSS